MDFAVEYVRKHYGADTYKQIILREGRHYLRKTIEFTHEDNNLLISNYNGEDADISGAKPIDCTWSSNEKISSISVNFNNW